MITTTPGDPLLHPGSSPAQVNGEPLRAVTCGGCGSATLLSDEELSRELCNDCWDASGSAEAKDESESDGPFHVPEFDPQSYSQPKECFAWWGWHPNYPYWSRSCWGGNTEDEAWKSIASPSAGGMEVYALKLVKESGGNLIVVAERPCLKLDVWRQIKKQKEAEGFER